MSDTEGARRWFDEYAEREWERLDRTLHGRVKYAIHRKLLDEALRPGMRVADIGCGPGRFAIDAIAAGARCTLVDISEVQLEQARRRLGQAVAGVDGFVLGDVCDLRLEDASFDLVLCYGGAISYAYDRYQDAVSQVARIAKPGAPVLVSVMSLAGTMRLLGTLDAVGFLRNWDDHLPPFEWGKDDVVLTRTGSPEFHLPLALFNAPGLERSFNSAGCDVERFAVSNPITIAYQDTEKISESAEAERRLVELELALCERPGLVDVGEHLIAFARKR